MKLNQITVFQSLRSMVSAIRQSIYRTRKQLLPINPSSLNEIHSALNNTDTSTSNGEEFLLIND